MAAHGGVGGWHGGGVGRAAGGGAARRVGVADAAALRPARRARPARGKAAQPNPGFLFDCVQVQSLIVKKSITVLFNFLAFNLIKRSLFYTHCYTFFATLNLEVST